MVPNKEQNYAYQSPVIEVRILPCCIVIKSERTQVHNIAIAILISTRTNLCSFSVRGRQTEN